MNQATNLLHEAALINGAWRTTPVTDMVFNPATGAEVGCVPRLSAADAKEAIEVAALAFPGWAGLLARERAEILRRWSELIQQHATPLAELLTSEQGKPHREAYQEVMSSAESLLWFAEETRRIDGDIIPARHPHTRILTLKQPVGVCAAITPWNFPIGMVARKVAPALAAGCTMVLKPAPATPFSALAFAGLGLEAGLPVGVFNVVTGPAEEIGSVLTSHPAVRKLSFTGSTAVGRLLMAQCAGTVKRLSLELGGHAPFIVFADANLDEAVKGAMASKYRNAGQTCVSANRIFVHTSLYDEFVNRMTAATVALKVGPGHDQASEVGPLINMAALEKVERHVADAFARGAVATVGGQRHALGKTYYAPTVLKNVTPDMLIMQEETFGPIAPIIPFTSEAEVVALANRSDYGLAAYFYARDHAQVWRVAEALEYGMVAVNSGLISTVEAPFGGIKQSGFGREGSKYGISEFLSVKYILLGGLAD